MIIKYIIMIFKNPLIVGVITSIICYTYLYLKKNKKEKNKKNKKTVSLVAPITVGLVSGFLAYKYLGENKEIELIKNDNIQVIEGGDLAHIKNTTLNLSSESSFKLVGTKKLDTLNPDVFIDLADF